MRAGEQTVVWEDGCLQAGHAGDELLVADSWLVDRGRVRGLTEHRARFTAACVAETGLAPTEVEAFLDAAAQRLPATGRWFPRVECGPQLRLRLRPAPPVSTSVVLRPHSGPDPRRKPMVKGPDLDALLAVRGLAAQAGANEAVLRTSEGFVLEGSLSALVWWRQETLCLPDRDLPVLDSVTRRLVESLATASGTPVRTERVSLSEVDGLEMWSLSALYGIRPVTGWLDCDLSPGPAVRAPAWQRRLDLLARPIPPR